MEVDGFTFIRKREPPPAQVPAPSPKRQQLQSPGTAPLAEQGADLQSPLPAAAQPAAAAGPWLAADAGLITPSGHWAMGIRRPEQDGPSLSPAAVHAPAQHLQQVEAGLADDQQESGQQPLTEEVMRQQLAECLPRGCPPPITLQFLVAQLMRLLAAAAATGPGAEGSASSSGDWTAVSNAAVAVSQTFGELLSGRISAAQGLLLTPGPGGLAAFRSLPPLLRGAAQGSSGLRDSLARQLAALREEEGAWQALHARYAPAPAPAPAADGGEAQQAAEAAGPEAGAGAPSAGQGEAEGPGSEAAVPQQEQQAGGEAGLTQGQGQLLPVTQVVPVGEAAADQAGQGQADAAGAEAAEAVCDQAAEQHEQQEGAVNAPSSELQAAKEEAHVRMVMQVSRVHMGGPVMRRCLAWDTLRGFLHAGGVVAHEATALGTEVQASPMCPCHTHAHRVPCPAQSPLLQVEAVLALQSKVELLVGRAEQLAGALQVSRASLQGFWAWALSLGAWAWGNGHRCRWAAGVGACTEWGMQVHASSHTNIPAPPSSPAWPAGAVPQRQVPHLPPRKLARLAHQAHQPAGARAATGSSRGWPGLRMGLLCHAAVAWLGTWVCFGVEQCVSCCALFPERLGARKEI